MIAWRPFTLMRIFGIRVSVGISWFLVLFLYIFWFTPSFHSVLGGSETSAYVVTVSSVLSFFVSIVLHELGHAFVARRNGLQVLGIELWMLGGLTRTSGDVKHARARVPSRCRRPRGDAAGDRGKPARRRPDRPHHTTWLRCRRGTVTPRRCSSG